MEIGTRIIKLREKKNWSQRELAKRAKLNPSVMNRIELGDRPLRDLELKTLAELLGVSIDYLINGERQSDEILEQIDEDSDFQHAMRSAEGFSEENKKKLLDYIEMIEELEKGRKPGDKQTRRNK